jgi:N-acyl-D-aspartate/D-glutamate deacylase
MPPETISFDRGSVLEQARRQRRHPVDVVLDAVVETQLRAIFTLFVFNPYDAVDHLRVMTDPNVLVSGNDTGAHLLAACQTASSVLLGNHVRRMGRLSLEQAVHLLTARQATELGFADRGRIAPGHAADLVIFDPERIDALAPQLVDDIPGGGRRFVQRALGIEHVMVGGRSVLEAGRATGETPGRFLGPGGSSLATRGL